MSIKLISVKNPIWVDTMQTAIDCEATMEIDGIVQTHMYTAVTYDTSDINKDVWDACIKAGVSPMADKDLSLYKVDVSNIRKDLLDDFIMVNGVQLSVDKASRQEMQHYVTEAIINGLVHIYWKLPNNSFRQYTVQEFKPVYKAVVTYVNQCYENEMKLLNDLDLATDPSSIDISAGWPSKDITTS